MDKEDLHFRLLVRTAEDAVGGGVYLHWWSEAAAGEPNSEGGYIPHLYEHTAENAMRNPDHVNVHGSSRAIGAWVVAT